jgi:PAS domain S-box-containing protein
VTISEPIRLLIIDDVADEAALVRAELADVRPGGFLVDAAGSLAEGLQALAGSPFDAALLDLGLPDSDGLDVIRRVKEDFPALPVIVMTGSDDEPLALEAVQLGAQDYLVKGQCNGQLIARSISYAIERSLSEASLREAQQRTRMFLEDAPVAVAMLDKDMRYLLASRRWLQDFGLDGQSIEGRGHAEIFPDSAELWARLHAGCLTGEVQTLDEEAVIRADRRLEWMRLEMRPWYEREGIIGGSIVFSEVITDKKLAQASLMESEAHLRAVVDNVIDGIVVYDEAGKVLEFNRAAVRMFGFAAGTISGQSIRTIIPDFFHAPDDGNPIAGLTSDEDRIIGSTRELVGRRSDGTTFAVEAGVSEVYSGGRRRMIATCRDITERKRVESMKTEFISTVSHELRTPLTSIQGALGLLVGGVAGPLSDQARELASIASKNSERLVRLINDILDIEKIEAGKMEFQFEPHLIRDLIEQAVAENASYAERLNVRIEVEGELPATDVLVDRDRFAQVMANLLSNACKFSPRGEAVTIEVNRRGTAVEVAVADKGEGIPEAFRTQIFEKFAQADASDSREKGGTGLGLAICKAIVERLGGRIGFEVANGTRFYFTIPEYPGAEDFWQADSGASQVLVCRAERDGSRWIDGALASNAYRAHFATTTDQAAELVDRHEFQAAIIDGRGDAAAVTEIIERIRGAHAGARLPLVVLVDAGGEEPFFGDDEYLETVACTDEEPRRLVAALHRGVAGRPRKRPRILHAVSDVAAAESVATVIGDYAQLVQVAGTDEVRARLQSEKFDLLIVEAALVDGAEAALVVRAGSDVPAIVISEGEVSPTLESLVEAAFVRDRTSNEALLETAQSLIENAGVYTTVTTAVDVP